MNPQHVIDFADNRIAHYQPLHDENRAEYDKALKEYKALPWYKEFFESHPNDDWWDWWRISSWIDELKDIRREAEYKMKMGYPRMDICKDWQKAFYRWAQANKIPC